MIINQINVPSLSYLARAIIRYLACSLAIITLASCASTNSVKDEEMRISLKRQPLPAEWKQSSVITLDYSTELRFIPSPQGNRVREKKVKWYRVNSRGQNNIEKVVLAEQRTIEKPIKINASVYYPDGSNWTLYNSSIYTKEEVLNNTKYYSFIIPKYQAGTLIKIEVEREYLQPEFFGRFFLRDRFPVWHRSIELSYPENVSLNHGLVNMTGTKHKSSSKIENGKSTIKISAEKLFDFKSPDKTMFPESLYETFYVSFPPKGLKSYSWQELGDHYLQMARKPHAVTPEIEKLSTSLSGKPFDEKLNKSFETVVNKTRYYGDWKGRFAFYPRSASDVLENGYGDCKELSTFLKSLLESTEVESSFVLLSTRGYIQPLIDYPYLGSFNHMILAAKSPNEKLFFLDPTHFWGNADNSYFDSIDRTALIITPNASRLITIDKGENFTNKVTTKTKIIPSHTDGVTIEGSITLSGYSAARFFEALKWTGHADVEKFSKHFLIENFEIYASEIELTKSTSSFIQIKYSAPLNESLIQIGKGGIKLNVPTLYKGDVQLHVSDNLGSVYLNEIIQKDTWELPFNPSTISTEDYESYIASYSWKVNGKHITRNYKQTSRKEPNSPSLEDWSNKVKTAINSVAWK